MAEGILAHTVFCMFDLDFILQQSRLLLGEIMKIWEEKQQSSKILFLNTSFG